MPWPNIAKWLAGSPPARTLHPVANTYAFLDTNIILEGKPLAELPWGAVDPRGPILVLLTPTVLSEVDSKKRDGRLGVRAREFNRLIGPVAATGQPLSLLAGPPEVVLALAMCDRIAWDKYDDLDLNDADSQIIAQVLHARGVPFEQRIVVSHDIKPISMASRHGLRVLHVSDDWLRPPEPSPADKQVQRLKAQLADLQRTEPDLHFEIKPETELPAHTYRVRPLTEEEKHKLLDGILKRNPPPKRAPQFHELFTDPAEYEEYSKYRRETVPAFLDAYHSKLEIQFGQIPITLIVSNRGNVRADNLVIRVSVSAGWLNEKAVFTQIRGPRPPRERSLFTPPIIPRFEPAYRPGKHDMHLAIEPERSECMEVHCEDFRHGRTWEFTGVLWLDPADSTECVLSVKATAANMHGELTTELAIPKVVQVISAGDLVDLGSGQVRQKPRVHSWLDEAIANKSFARIEWDRSGKEEDD